MPLPSFAGRFCEQRQMCAVAPTAAALPPFSLNETGLPSAFSVTFTTLRSETVVSTSPTGVTTDSSSDQM